MIAWFHKIAPPSVEKRMILVMDNLKYAVGGYFKAQFKIMGVDFFDPVCRISCAWNSLCGFGCIFDFIFGFSANFLERELR